MTPANFKRYCQRNKLIRVTPTEFCIDFFFENGKRIVARTTYDGIEYNIWKKPKPGASKQLFADLNALIPDIAKHYKERYGGSSVLLAQNILGINKT